MTREETDMAEIIAFPRAESPAERRRRIKAEEKAEWDAFVARFKANMQDTICPVCGLEYSAAIPGNCEQHDRYHARWVAKWGGAA
jgi:hypothetical protein